MTTVNRSLSKAQGAMLSRVARYGFDEIPDRFVTRAAARRSGWFRTARALADRSLVVIRKTDDETWIAARPSGSWDR